MHIMHIPHFYDDTERFYLFIYLFIYLLGFTSHQHCNGYIATFEEDLIWSLRALLQATPE